MPNSDPDDPARPLEVSAVDDRTEAGAWWYVPRSETYSLGPFWNEGH